MNYSYKTFFQKLYQNQKKQYAFDSKTREEALTWQREFRETLRKSLGLEQLEILASGLTEVPIVQEEVQEDGYLRKKIVLETLPDVFMPFYMLIPDGTDRKHPSRA
ncbi:alpha/beta hydrolase family protein, partial [Eisenbergiella tayi]